MELTHIVVEFFDGTWIPVKRYPFPTEADHGGFNEHPEFLRLQAASERADPAGRTAIAGQVFDYALAHAKGSLRDALAHADTMLTKHGAKPGYYGVGVQLEVSGTNRPPCLLFMKTVADYRTKLARDFPEATAVERRQPSAN
jgi:hypothetical protein